MTQGWREEDFDTMEAFSLLEPVEHSPALHAAEPAQRFRHG